MTLIRATTLLVVIIFGGGSVFAQFTFIGDYDKTFAAPNGYNVDPQEPDPTVSTFQTLFYTGEYAPDGSIIAGGMLRTSSDTVDFYMRKFTPTGAVDTSFGTNGVVRTNFHSRFDGVPTYDIPQILKVQPDGKILFAGYCPTLEPNPQTRAFGADACVMRYNPNGTLDQTFGGNLLVYNADTPNTYSTQIDPGKLIFQTGLIADGRSFGTLGTFYDIAIQPDGKIVLVGETRNYASFHAPQGYGAIVVRLNSNGSLDSTFGAGGIARWNAPQNGSCFPERRFLGVRLQADGRIIAVGHDGATTDCFQGQFFAVTRWTSSGQLETVRRLDNSTDIFQHERAVSAHFTRDGSRLIVSGAYKSLRQNPSSRLNPTMVRLNVGDLSLDTSFGVGGIAQYNVGTNNWQSSTLYVKAIQPDGRIIGSDNANVSNSNGVVRLNPNGSADNSFGNLSIDGSNTGRGRLRVDVTNGGGSSSPMERNPHILVRANGKINLLGYTAAFFGSRAVVSQQNTTFENGIYSDFTNDGKTDIGVFRFSTGAWFYLNSANNQSNGVAFGQSGDKPAPADYDGDGRTDVAVFRDGVWYLQQSTKGFTGISFGAAGDLPCPGDFDGDGLADISVFRPSTGIWYRLNSSNNQFVGVQFGQTGDVPLLADFDADGKTDIAVFRQGFWYYIRSSDNEFRAVQFGTPTDIPVAGDYDGDSQADVAVFRPSNGTWYRINSSNGGLIFNQFGQNGDRPVPGDYDNDGKNDLAIFRNGTWYVVRSGDNSVFGVSFGAATDIPVPAAYLP